MKKMITILAAPLLLAVACENKPKTASEVNEEMNREITEEQSDLQENIQEERQDTQEEVRELQKENQDEIAEIRQEAREEKKEIYVSRLEERAESIEGRIDKLEEKINERKKDGISTAEAEKTIALAGARARLNKSIDLLDSLDDENWKGLREPIGRSFEEAVRNIDGLESDMLSH